ncbi:MAG: ATP-dependent DNA ligase [Halobacteriales archaeon]
MEYSALVAVYADLEATSGTHEKRRILAGCLAAVEPGLLPAVVKLVRGRIFAPWESRELGVSTALAQAAVAKATGVDEGTLEDWWREAGDLGDAAARAVDERTQRTLVTAPLEVEQVYETLRSLAGYEGEGSQARRVDDIAGLVADADPDEARYLIRTVVGAMRLGVGEGLVRDAVADAFLDGSDAAVEAVQRAYEVTNDFGLVAERARTDGRAGLAELDVEVFRPVKPMLARKAEDLGTAIEALADGDGRVLLEAKYDGMRAKLHRADGTLRVFTRRLEDVTAQFPDVVEAVEAGVDAETYILEAEVVGRDPGTGGPVPFQELSRRIKRKHDVEAAAEAVPVTVYLFDLLYLDGRSRLDDPLRERLAALEDVFEPADGQLERATNVRTGSLGPAEAFYEDALAAGHEGVMAKNLDATYQPGSRVGYQLKVKSTMEPLDLVVTRAKWSEGRKSGFLGRPYLACRGSDGSLLEVGRMHTGFTDAQLEAFTERVEPLIRSIDGREATLRPEVVLEVEYEEIQRSTTYDSGYALRFPRLKRIRDDLGPGDADTLDRVERLYDQQG